MWYYIIINIIFEGGINLVTYIIYLIIAAVIFLFVYMAYAWFVNNKVSVKTVEVEEALEEMAAKDASWNEEKIYESVQRTFYQIQAAIADKDLKSIQELTHPNLYSKWKVQIENAPAYDFSNMKNKEIQDIIIIDAEDFRDSEKDCFTASIDINANDYTVDKHGDIIFVNCEYSTESDKSVVTEYWKFEKQKDEWKLYDVGNSANWKEYVNCPIIEENKSM